MAETIHLGEIAIAVTRKKIKHVRYDVSERRAVQSARFCLSSIRYQSCRDPLTGLRQCLRELAQTPRAVRLSPAIAAVAARRLGARQEALLSPVF
jgi:hypothetical protein